mmetsp:Transcript_131934/g.329051  ORF Transcript_131934/g.329051 Transcript_131934/m.329051 type:complete len:204 (-) Transcript_131934:21-632(-)
MLRRASRSQLWPPSCASEFGWQASGGCQDAARPHESVRRDCRRRAPSAGPSPSHLRSPRCLRCCCATAGLLQQAGPAPAPREKLPDGWRPHNLRQPPKRPQSRPTLPFSPGRCQLQAAMRLSESGEMPSAAQGLPASHPEQPGTPSSASRHRYKCWAAMLEASLSAKEYPHRSEMMHCLERPTPHLAIAAPSTCIRLHTRCPS